MVIISGTASGIGYATAVYFLQQGYEVLGIDRNPSGIIAPHYHHAVADVREAESLPEVEKCEYVISAAGVQDEKEAIDVNLKGTINLVEKYAFNPAIRSVLMIASSSAHTGFEFPDYSASKGGVLAYMKNVAWRLAEKYKATCNSLSFGGVITPLNDPVMQDEKAWQDIMKVTPLKKWMTGKECAEWIYFMTVVNKSCSGQDILIDNGEKDLNCTFVWPEGK